MKISNVWFIGSTTRQLSLLAHFAKRLRYYYPSVSPSSSIFPYFQWPPFVTSERLRDFLLFGENPKNHQMFTIFKDYSKCRSKFLNFIIFYIFFPITFDLSGNTDWLQASVFQFLWTSLAMLNETFSMIFRHRAKYSSFVVTLIMMMTMLKLRVFSHLQWDLRVLMFFFYSIW